MRFLIDTHTFIWYIQNSENLTTSATKIINDGINKILLSTASVSRVFCSTFKSRNREG
jgi:PIN domain nuclease of toxin-antitoxin system